ncbi:MAG: Asp-tRNA(Asn)/Glu-tRNA(Gln) amidotransferase subunit GatC [Candidatus Marinimicrobia bacterium]|nr:Asp-tRNA(Asn)/Glu-tRNA(Gln) amidotransferase subunit GatC [Candidatus Neomarinimicrobiota bacterium]
MAISKKDVEHIAELAKLKLSESEIERYSGQLGDILDYIEQINELDLGNVEPLNSVLDAVNISEEDIIQKTLSREDVMSNNPAGGKKYFTVPRVIGSEEAN